MFALSLFIVAFILIDLILGAIFFKIDIVIILLFLLMFVCFITLIRTKNISEITEYISDSIKDAVPAFLMFILIGILIASWISSGTLPTLIYYGLNLLNQKYFFLCAYLFCAIATYATGTSWAMAGTIGVALMGIAKAMDVNLALSAGAIISGVYFGDKQSPLAATSILVSASCKTNLNSHLDAMKKTGFLTFFITGVVYLILGLDTQKEIPSDIILGINSYLQTHFVINIFNLIPMILTLFLSILRLSGLISLSIGILSALGFALFVQGFSPSELSVILSEGFKSTDAPDNIKAILDQGGLTQIYWTFFLSFLGFSLGGVLNGAGYLKVIFKRLKNFTNSTIKLSLITFLIGYVGCLATAEVYVAQMLSGTILKDSFAKQGLSSSMLSRFVEESTTVFDMFVPWTTGGAFMFSVLGVFNLDFLPYAFFCYLTPIISLIFTIFNLDIRYEK